MQLKKLDKLNLKDSTRKSEFFYYDLDEGGYLICSSKNQDFSLRFMAEGEWRTSKLGGNEKSNIERYFKGDIYETGVLFINEYKNILTGKKLSLCEFFNNNTKRILQITLNGNCEVTPCEQGIYIHDDKNDFLMGYSSTIILPFNKKLPLNYRGKDAELSNEHIVKLKLEPAIPNSKIQIK